MSWHALLYSPTDDANIWRQTHRSHQLTKPARSLGSATADARWRWASPGAGNVTPITAERSSGDEFVATQLGVARELRAEMAEMARVMGRSEDDIWAEAAREWLMRRLRNDGPPPTTPAAAPVPGARPSRMWNEIDELLTELRHLRYITAPATPTAPAA
ncbi:MAG TPA: hypothetical protein VH591_01500 [Ktedonobacterales bacterium]